MIAGRFFRLGRGVISGDGDGGKLLVWSRCQRPSEMTQPVRNTQRHACHFSTLSVHRRGPTLRPIAVDCRCVVPPLTISRRKFMRYVTNVLLVVIWLNQHIISERRRSTVKWSLLRRPVTCTNAQWTERAAADYLSLREIESETTKTYNWNLRYTNLITWH